jgi:two-component system, LuxR family, response regulator FixJ
MTTMHSNAAPSPECTVFVVDDDDCAREALQCLLEAEGFRVQAYSGANGMLGETKMPDNSCLVTDYNMPEMDGLELVAALRARGNSMPAILVTGDPNSTVHNRAAAANVPVIGKLNSPNSLVGCIKGMMNAGFN